MKLNISESIDKNLKTLDLNEYELERRVASHDEKPFIQKQPLKISGKRLEEQPFRVSK